MEPSSEQSETRLGAPPEARRLEVAAWGVFFIWVGVAVVANIPIGVGLIGVGAIVLVAHAARKVAGMPRAWSWIIVGLGLVAAGLGNRYALDVPFIPVLLFGTGALLLALAVGRSGRGHDEM